MKLSGDGRVVVRRRRKHVARPIVAETALAGCQREGEVGVRKSRRRRRRVHQAPAARGHRQPLRLDRAAAADRKQHSLGDRNSRARPALVHGDRDLSAIPRHAEHPLLDAWSDSGLAVPGGTFLGTGPCYTGDFGATVPIHYPGWTDPLRAMPLRNRKFYYGAAYTAPRTRTSASAPSRTDLFCIPLATFVEPSDDTGLTVALSPDDKLPELTMTTDEEGSLVLFADLPSHRREPARLFRVGSGGPRGRLARRDAVDGRALSQYFDPPLPRADRMAGCAAYSADERHFDTRRSCTGWPFARTGSAAKIFPTGHVPARSTTTTPNGALAAGAAGRRARGRWSRAALMNAYGKWMHTPGLLRAELLQRGGVRQ